MITVFLKKTLAGFSNSLKIAVAHGKRGHGPGVGLPLAPPDPLFGVEEKKLVAITVDQLRYENRTTNIEAEIVEAEWSRTRELGWIGAVIARPGV